MAALLSIPADRVLLVSIGTTNGAQKRTVLSAAAELVTNLDSGAEGAHHASCALATDADTVCKNASAEVGAWGQPRHRCLVLRASSCVWQ